MTRFALLASSLVPALLVLVIRMRTTHNVVAMILLIASLLLIVMLARAVRARSTTSAQPFTTEIVTDESEQVPAYLLTYVFPFLFLTFDDGADMIACAIFASLVLVLVYRTDLALVNPLLLIVGFHLFRVQTNSGGSLTLVSKVRPLKGQTFTAVKICEGTYKLVCILD